MAVSTFTAAGAKATAPAKLNKDLFGLTVESHDLLKEAYVAYMANGRENYAKTLLRGEVRGGGKKPWKQKGTGRARVGSTRSPIWRSGGVTFGPSGNENYSKKINAKAKKLALKQALTLAASDKNFVVIEDFVVKDGKTKTAAKLLEKLNASSRTLIVVDKKDDKTLQAVNNLPEVTVITAAGLNVYDTLNASNIVATKAALTALEQRLGSTK
jgi:large subunit ribosomal protein L4